MSVYYPPVSFYFTVDIKGTNSKLDSSFMEVAGLNAEREIIEIKEGGENLFSHRVPGRGKYGNLILKRGVVLPTSDLAIWCEDIMETDLGTPITTKGIVISLLNASGSPLLVWNVVDAWPVKWSVSDLGAEKNELAIETLELAYSYFTKAPGSGSGART